MRLYLHEVLQRIARETDVKKLLPHARKQHFKTEGVGRRNAIIDLFVRITTASSPQRPAGWGVT